MNIFEDKKGALIDMDGVLYDSMPGHTLAWKRMMEDLGVECTRDEFYLYEGMTGEATINLLFERAFGKGCPPEKAKELYAIKSRYFREWGSVKKMPGAGRMLSALKRGGLERVLVTGSGQQSLLESIFKDYPGIFEEGCMVTAHDVVYGKPSPEPYLKGAEKADVPPEDCIVIENAPLGVRAGKSAGCFTIAVTTGPIPREAFEKEGADMIFESMESFADYLERELGEYERRASLMPSDSYVIYSDDLSSCLEELIYVLNADKVFMLTDSNVGRMRASQLPFVDSRETIEAGEKSKDIKEAVRLWEWLSKSGATRRSVLINFGGGVVSDIGGFVAATFKRGIRYINVPTTLLAAVDASIGGKTGIDFMGCKNEVGAFAMPEKTVVYAPLFSTLRRRELLSGYGETIKMALLTDRRLYDELIKGDALTDKDLLAKAARSASKAKEQIVRLDPKERGLRRILNLGHTAGHAFEMLGAKKGIDMSHGEAVAHGIYVALLLSEKLQGFPSEETGRYRERVLERYYSPLPFGKEDVEELIAIMGHDKKNRRSGEVSFVLLQSPGNPVESTVVGREDLRRIMEESCDKN